MRIFYASLETPNVWLSSNVWRSNLLLPLKDLGHDVVEFQYDLRETFRNTDFDDPEQEEFIKKNRPRVSQEILRQIRGAHAAKPIDLFFSYFYDACVLPEAIQEIRAMGIKTVNWYCNGSFQLNLVSEISPHYDWCLVPEKFRLKDYESIGARPIYCQEAANSSIYKPSDVPVEFDVTFVGQAYGDRPVFIRYLLDHGIDVRVWGLGWDRYLHKGPLINALAVARRASSIGRKFMTPAGRRKVMRRLRGLKGRASPPPFPSTDGVTLPAGVVGGVLSDTHMVEMYSRSKINLGFSTCGNTHTTGERILQIRLRDFEVTMSGGFYMVEYMEELEEFFKVGEEIVCYHSKEDLIDKIRYYLDHDGEREKIRKAGYERCRLDHTWRNRFQAAFREMGLG